MVTSTARQKVLELLQRRGRATAAQVGQALSMSPAAVRHHLSILRRDGRVTLDHSQTSARRGRPEQVYRLSDRVLGENLGPLADALLSTWLDGVPAEDRDAALQALGARFAAQAAPVDLAQPAARRLVKLVEKLNAMGYQARWEAGARGPRLLLGHCPYAAIIGAHPELCRVDAALLGALIDADMHQQAKIDPRPGGAAYCIFAVERAG